MAAPLMDLTTTYTAPPDPVNIPFVDLASTTVVIDINATRVTDGVNTGYLSDILRINEENKLTLDSELLVSDGENEAPFDFKYDDEGEKFGAGTAFLQDEE